MNSALKKTAHAAEQERPDVAVRRRAWFDGQPDFDPGKLKATFGLVRDHGLQALVPDMTTALLGHGGLDQGALRDHPPLSRLAPDRGPDGAATLAFYEAYFSNFIEGTEFAVEEAADIVFRGVIPNERPEDAHDVLGTWRIVSDMTEMCRTPQDGNALKGLVSSVTRPFLVRQEYGPLGQHEKLGKRLNQFQGAI